LFTPVPPPFASADATDAVRQINEESKPEYRMWFLWPFKFTVVTMVSGSRNFLLEFRPLMKFSVTVGFFWKR
jgi:hypothetical protein